MNRIAPYRKALMGAAVAGLTALAAAFTDDHVTAAEWVTVAIAVLAGGAGVYAVPNRPKPPQ